MVAANSSSPTPASVGPWEPPVVEDPGAAGDRSAENLYFQGKGTCLVTWDNLFMLAVGENSCQY